MRKKETEQGTAHRRGATEARRKAGPKQPVVQKCDKFEHGNYTVGRTIVDPKKLREKDAVAAREVALRQRRHRNIFVWLSLALFLIAFTVMAVSLVSDYSERRRVELAYERDKAITPSVEIVDENAGVEISRRTKLFIVGLEEDMQERGLAIDHVVLPLQKVRQVIVFVEGREEYYKLSIDRQSSVQVEDMARMMEFLDKKGISCSYVDLRVEGRAYYK